MKKQLAAALTTLTLLFPLHATAQGLSEDRVRELVLETIRQNPEIVMEAVEILRARDAELQAVSQATVLTSERDILERDPNAPVLGNPDGDVTVVEFFDYNCPYCRKVKPEVEALLSSDQDVRVVYHEWPILGEGSVFAARAALAARKQGKYNEFHWAMMAMNGRAEQASVLRVAEEVGLDLVQLRRDMDAPEVTEHIETTMRLAQSLGFNGTPSFVIRDALLPGILSFEELQGFVTEARGTE